MNFKDKQILVLGDSFLDIYEFGDCTRISQEAPVPIVKIDHSKTKTVPGGAANVASNVRSLGAFCTLVTYTGDDKNGRLLEDLLEDRGVYVEVIHPEKFRTITKKRILAQNQQIVRIDDEDHAQYVCPTSNMKKQIAESDAVIISDYGKNFWTYGLAKYVIKTAQEFNKLVVVDCKPKTAFWYRGANWFTPNEKERTEAFDDLGDLLITKGAKGITWDSIEGVGHVDAIKKEVVDVSGAGDTVIAAFTLALVSGVEIKEAVEFANKAAGVVVGKQGTSTVTIEEIEALEKAVR